MPTTMDKETALEHLEAHDRRAAMRSRSSMSSMVLHALPLMMMGGDMRNPNLGNHRGEYRKPKNLNNDPDRAKGMKEFKFDLRGELDPHNPDPEYVINNGTLKAARKKLALIRAQL